MKRCTKAILYKDNLKYNLEQIKKAAGENTKICVAVKADSYGHNAILTSKLAEEMGIEYLAVATVDEGIELRKNGIGANILILSLCTPEEYDELFEYRITPMIFSFEVIDLLKKAACNCGVKDFPVFLAIDSGMGRVGCYPEEAGEEAKKIVEGGFLKLEGMCTHFAVSDSLQENNVSYTQKQYESFCKAVENVEKAGISSGIKSCCNSAAFLNNKNMHFDMVRPGIITYGYYPDEITEDYLKSVNNNFNIKPVMAFETQVVAIKAFKKGQSVSYGRTWVCEKDTKIAILPVGYADGLLRRFSPGLEVTIRGKKYPVRGRICMDQCMVDIGIDNDEVCLWDKVLIFGPEESGAKTTAENLAKIGNTISYEVLTSISKRVERIIL